MTWLATERGLDFASYEELHRWSVEDLEAFWRSLATYFGVRWRRPASAVLEERRMPGAVWFPGGQLNWAEHALQADGSATAIVSRSETGERREWTYGDLRSEVSRARAGLARLGVRRGDRVAGYLANTPEAVAALLAVTSLGAVWSSCPPEFGVSAVLDRFQQIEPRVLLAHDGYPYAGRWHDRSRQVEEIRRGLTRLEATVVVERPGRPQQATGIAWRELTAETGALEFEAVPFDYPLWVLYSSGTTGLPKALVHGHGGIVLEHLKQLALQNDLGPDDRFFWFSTTGWMMWNYLVSGLLLGSTIVLYEGAPGHPDLGALFRMVAEEGITYFGTSAPFIIACRKAGLAPGESLDLGALRAVGSTGAPLPREGFEWVYEALKPDLALGSISGGTDVCSAFVGASPLLPVRSGEIQCKGLGTAAEAFDPEGRPIVDAVGELVITEPMPSMPVAFWGDADGARYRESYFSTYPGVWRHGDWIRFDAAGRSVIYGRSDSTLNRGGVRMGTSEFYRVIDRLDEVADSLVIDSGGQGGDGRLWLFVVMAEGHCFDESLAERLRAALRSALSPRHVPDEIRAVPDLPRTLSGKKLEVPIRRLLSGVPEADAVNRHVLANPGSLAAFLPAALTASAGRDPSGARSSDALAPAPPPAGSTWIVGHRGVAGEAVENTRPSIELALSQAADMIEVDVQLTADGELVVFHDWDLVRLAGDQSVVERSAAKELQALHPIMDVAELLTVVPPSMPLNIELKRRQAPRPELAAAVLTALEGRSGVVLSSFDWQLLFELRQRDAGIPVAPLAEEAEGLAEVARELGAWSANCHRASASRELVEACAPRPVFVYTVNRVEEARALIARGVGGLFTDTPGRMRRDLGLA